MPENHVYAGTSRLMNSLLAKRVLEASLAHGITEFCVCPGARNAPLVSLLAQNQALTKFHWFEERSAAFFALGRSRLTGRPVAIVTTSGTAAAELLPATIEAYYTGIPLLLITADRPRRFRGTGAPQTAEQVGLLGRYVLYEEDLALEESCALSLWDRKGPAHLNVCFEEPLQWSGEACRVKPPVANFTDPHILPCQGAVDTLQNFFEGMRYPFVVVGSLQPSERPAVLAFLLKLNLPIYLEGVSGLRENLQLAHLRIKRSDHLWQAAAAAGYPIDAVLRIGGIPTFRLWRDLEDRKGKVKVCSISALPFPGLSWGVLIYTPLSGFLPSCDVPSHICANDSSTWLAQDRDYATKLVALFAEEPLAEPSLVHSLSLKIPAGSMVYLGNSLPIREWDFAATASPNGFEVFANRGVNGIDGQISTFLGLCSPQRENWAIIGDLTALYDMAGPWILQQLADLRVTVVVINNGGGQIFSRMFVEKEFLHEHGLNFSPLAAMWKMEYLLQRDSEVQISSVSKPGNRLIEIQPDAAATKRFWKKLTAL